MWIHSTACAYPDPIWSFFKTQTENPMYEFSFTFYSLRQVTTSCFYFWVVNHISFSSQYRNNLAILGGLKKNLARDFRLLFLIFYESASPGPLSTVSQIFTKSCGDIRYFVLIACVSNSGDNLFTGVTTPAIIVADVIVNCESFITGD